MREVRRWEIWQYQWCLFDVSGFYQDTKGLQDCVECKVGEAFVNFKTSCSGCALGTYGSSKGVCSKCPAGTYQDGKGETACKECDVDTYLNEPGKSSKADCTSCSIDRSTGIATGSTNASACLCKRTDYYKNEQNECEMCMPGADCSSKDGITLSELTALPGYWRANANTFVFTDCTVAFSSSLQPDIKAKERCWGGNNSSAANTFDPNSQCLSIQGEESYGGPSCMSCLNKQYTMSNGKCVKCEGEWCHNL